MFISMFKLALFFEYTWCYCLCALHAAVSSNVLCIVYPSQNSYVLTSRYMLLILYSVDVDWNWKVPYCILELHMKGTGRQADRQTFHSPVASDAVLCIRSDALQFGELTDPLSSLRFSYCWSDRSVREQTLKISYCFFRFVSSILGFAFV